VSNLDKSVVEALELEALLFAFEAIDECLRKNLKL
jgi:hypothetical protein